MEKSSLTDQLSAMPGITSLASSSFSTSRGSQTFRMTPPVRLSAIAAGSSVIMLLRFAAMPSTSAGERFVPESHPATPNIKKTTDNLMSL